MRGHSLLSTIKREREGGEERKRKREKDRERKRQRERSIDEDKGGRKGRTKRGKMLGVRPITQADGANQGAMRLP